MRTDTLIFCVYVGFGTYSNLLGIAQIGAKVANAIPIRRSPISHRGKFKQQLMTSVVAGVHGLGAEPRKWREVRLTTSLVGYKGHRPMNAGV